jgi:ABC-type amino acid transport substrate-binding protein
MSRESQAVTERRFHRRRLRSALTVAGCGGDARIVSEKAANLDTITRGVLKVAIQPYAPYTDPGDTIVGLDGDILNAVAESSTSVERRRSPTSPAC